MHRLRLRLKERLGVFALVATLAAACGQTLVRINLSEQTDFADLVGSDLPAPTTEQSPSSSSSSSSSVAS